MPGISYYVKLGIVVTLFTITGAVSFPFGFLPAGIGGGLFAAWFREKE